MEIYADSVEDSIYLNSSFINREKHMLKLSLIEKLFLDNPNSFEAYNNFLITNIDFHQKRNSIFSDFNTWRDTQIKIRFLLNEGIKRFPDKQKEIEFMQAEYQKYVENVK